MVLVCHVISQDHMVKGSCDFMGGSPSWYFTTLPSWVAIGIVVMEIQCLLWLKGEIPHALAQIRHYCLSLKHIACHASTCEISGHRHYNLPVCPMKDSRSWSRISTRTTDGTYLNLPVLPKTELRIRNTQKKNGNYKAFCLTRRCNNASIITISI